MTRSHKKNALIALQVLILSALILWIVALGRQDQQTLDSRIILPEQEAQTITIERDDIQLEFERDESGWQMTKPLKQAADENRITALLSLLTLPSSHRYKLSDIDTDQLGLSPAQATVQINQTRFEFGNTDVEGQKRYLKVGNAVYLINDLIFPIINGSAATFTSSKATE